MTKKEILKNFPIPTKFGVKRIIASILTFGLSERMGSKPTNGITMTGGNELRRAIGEGRVTFI